jgi:hypothetical protein
MSTDWGKGIHTGQEVFNSEELTELKQAEETNRKLQGAYEQLTTLRDDFDKLIKNVSNLTVENKFSDKLRTGLMLDIQTVRDNSLQKIKEELLR